MEPGSRSGCRTRSRRRTAECLHDGPSFVGPHAAVSLSASRAPPGRGFSPRSCPPWRVVARRVARRGPGIQSSPSSPGGRLPVPFRPTTGCPGETSRRGEPDRFSRVPLSRGDAFAAPAAPVPGGEPWERITDDEQRRPTALRAKGQERPGPEQLRARRPRPGRPFRSRTHLRVDRGEGAGPPAVQLPGYKRREESAGGR